MSTRLAVGCALAALAIPASGFAQAQPGDAAGNWAAITECASITDAERRLACMDNVLRRAGIDTVAAGDPAPLPPLVRTERAAPPPPAPPRPAPASSPREELVTTIASVRAIAYRRMLVTAADGSVWEQTEAEEFLTPPKAGDTFSVEPAAMNSFRCHFNQSSRYRCRQVN